MTMRNVKSSSVLGFLTVVRDEECGLFGGYLLLNRLGRPLEFHCTAPLRPNRAQEILYGPTLEPFLYGEQIGLTLLRQTKTEPIVVCIDQPPALALRELVDTPVALVLPRLSDPVGDDTARDEQRDGAAPDETPGLALGRPRQFRVDPPHGASPRLHVFLLGRHRLAVAEASPADRDAIVAGLSDLSDALDLEEPFGRIREAIEEARRGGQQR
jgi:hypothetical protein